MNKKVTKRRIVFAGGVIALFFILIFNMPFFSCSLKNTFFSVMNLPTNRKRARLLCKTNYQVLLETCREVMKRGDLVSGRVYESSQFPKEIRKLVRSAIKYKDNTLNIYIYGFMDRFGVIAYSQDFEAPKGYTYRGKKLIPGLWYWDEGIGRSSDYDKWIEIFIQKGKKKQAQADVRTKKLIQ